MEFELTKNQQAVFDTVENCNDNILITGKPGVGKSVLINALVSEGRKTYTLAAPTGLAALNIGGKTLHSLFRIPVSGGIFTADFNKFTDADNVLMNVKYQIKHLIIDEVSMVRADVFDYIDRFCRFAKGVDKPFGGIQLIVVGDFFQLQPVVIGAETVQLRTAGYDSPFIFNSNVFASANFKVLQLTEVLRQKGDNKFIKILDGARTGELSEKQLHTINQRVEAAKDLRIQLVSTNKEAVYINDSKLAALAEPQKEYTANYFGEWPDWPCDPKLKLRVGAHVMVKVNKADRPNNYTGRGEFISQVVNGTIGKVVEMLDGQTKIETADGIIISIYTKRWERKVKVKRDDKWEEQVVASFEQMPLALAWAISIHKSQGQSFDVVHIDPAKIFAAGQMYVALSRCRTLAGLSLERAVKQSKFFADRKVLAFYDTIE